MALPIKLNLPTGFLDPEVRCGYEVSAKLKKIWAVELDLLAELMRVCNKYGLRYHVCYGSMIGAVRHHGFIPWDDDMDVWLPRKDYDRLCEIAPTEFRHPYFFQTDLSDRRYFTGVARFRNSLTTAAIRGNETDDFNNGIFIDVYPMDAAPRSSFQDKIQTFLQRTAMRGAKFNRGQNNSRSALKRAIGRGIGVLAHLVPYRAWVAFYNWTMKLNGTSEVYAPLFSMSDHEKQIRVNENEFNESVMMAYEFLNVPVPKSYDRILSTYYGNYMEFPPAEERGLWHEDVIRFDPDMPYKEWLTKNIAKER